MKRFTLNVLPCVLAGLALAACIGTLLAELGTFRAAVVRWATDDLSARAELAAETLAEAIHDSDFFRLREFGTACAAEGLRFTVFSGPGGVIFDSRTGAQLHETCPEVVQARREGAGFSLRPSGSGYETFLYCARRVDNDRRHAGECVVRLGIPSERMLAPFMRARQSLILAGVVGASALLLVVLSLGRLWAHSRRLARERDDNARLVEELRKVEAFRRDFIADVSHELKTPLTGILGAVDLLSGDPPASDRAVLLGMLKTESVRLNALAQDILALARLEQGAQKGVAMEAVDMADLVAETVRRFQGEAEARGVKLTVLPAAGDFTVTGNAELLVRALANLVLNALKHSGSAEVTLVLARREDRVRVVVEDAGCGIPPDQAERIFERFYRVDDARTRARGDVGGSGLGLAIVRQIAHLHHGEVSYEPRLPQGSRFILEVAANA